VVHGSVPLRSTKPDDIDVSPKSSPLRNLILVDNLLACDFLDQQSPAIALPTQLGYTTQLSDCHTCLPLPQLKLYPLCSSYLSGAIRSVAGWRHAYSTNWFTKLLQTANLQALVLYGSPYLRAVSPNAALRDSLHFSYGQMPVAQAIALETLFGIWFTTVLR